MTTASEMRQWLHDNGRPQSVKGRISDGDRAFYDAAHGEAPAPDEAEFDEAMGVSAADFPEEEDELEEDAGPGVTEERTPRSRASRTRKPSAARAGGLVRGLIGGQSKSKRKPASKKGPPRVSLEKFVSRGWTMLGRMAISVSPPMGRCLQAQAPMAGIILEDIARGTVTDRLLQPLARAEDKLDKGFALAAPPLLVGLIDMANGLPPKEAAARQAVLVPMLRESLRIMMEVSESYAEAITERLEQNMKFDADIDRLLGAIFDQAEAQAETPEPEMADA
jgi:hypothetical protein